MSLHNTSVHHVTHREDGGGNEDENLVVAHKSCHKDLHAWGDKVRRNFVYLVWLMGRLFEFPRNANV
jgi:5-methylcytosine-specific restriction endonuclease McrA